MTAPTLYEKLSLIQCELKAPKSQYNSFGNYYYRSCEDILEAVKPLCNKQKITMTISDEIVCIEGWHYVKATVTLHDWESVKIIKNIAYARENATKKGMDDSQITGATSTYARKYALNGLFNIDDTKDNDDQKLKKEQEERAKKAEKEKKGMSESERQTVINRINKGIEILQNTYHADIASEQFKNFIMEKAGINTLGVSGLSDEELTRYDVTLRTVIKAKEQANATQ